MQKRSLIISGHKTSIAMEPEFWLGLENMAYAQNIKLVDLIAKIDRERENKNLTSALRVTVLNFYRAK